ncbi:MAG TPA: ABC transporter ATP-binding protein [Bdellovibrionota bacterium]|nr:ABC transporter ATP-binding protein [Bdellovibrionota bacterium]
MTFREDDLRIDGLSFFRGETVILKNISLRLPAHALGALVGPSGSGKTTLLRLIAGFERPAEGSIVLGGETYSSPVHVLPPERRGIGIVFQDFALFPHLSVEENVAYGLFRATSEQRRQRSAYVLELLGLAPFAKRYPQQLSGGQQQRVALGRALAPNPKLLLLDEPFSQLDPELREELIQVMNLVLRETKITTLLVTHHQEDAYDLAEHLGVLEGGDLLQWGDPFELYHSPRNRFVADFLGKGALLPATVESAGFVQTEIGRLPCAKEWPIGEVCELLVRPDDLVHVDGDGHFSGTLLKKRFRGSAHLYTIELPSRRQVLALVPSHHNHRVGERVGLEVDMRHVNLYPFSGELRSFNFDTLITRGHEDL